MTRLGVMDLGGDNRDEVSFLHILFYFKEDTCNHYDLSLMMFKLITWLR